jgi:hypothetical protein
MENRPTKLSMKAHKNPNKFSFLYHFADSTNVLQCTLTILGLGKFGQGKTLMTVIQILHVTDFEIFIEM